MSGKQDRRRICPAAARDRAAATPFALPRNRWDAAIAQQKSPAELLLYRSNLLGADLTVTNFGGGNTSAKLIERDPLYRRDHIEVLWVKGSGGNIGSMGLDGFRHAVPRQAAPAENRLYKRPGARRRDGGLPAPLYLQPQHARGFHRHAAARIAAVRARRPCSSRCDYRAGRRRGRRGRRRRRSGAAGRDGCRGNGPASTSA
jgi:hypothetical protein